MGSEKVRLRRSAGFAVGFGKRNDGSFFYNNNGVSKVQPPPAAAGLRAGNRGQSRHRWWRGPREPPSPSRGPYGSCVFSLFIDGIPRSMSIPELGKIFEKEGEVLDVYISRKIRSNKKDGFGFVRFRDERAAMRAIKNLNGLVISGSKLLVSMAKYQKGDTSIVLKQNFDYGYGKGRACVKNIKNPSFRDNRRYSEVLLGKKRLSSTLDQNNNVISVLFSLKVSENSKISENLAYAVIVEMENIFDPSSAASLIMGSDIPTVSISSLSPTKLLLFFNSEQETINAVEDASPLWSLFDDVRRWSEGEFFSDRLVWIEVCGLHPKGWSLDNIRMIGEKWGTVLYIDHNVNGVNSLSSARLVVRTKAQNKIDAQIRIEWESGCFDVWVKETGLCGCKEVCDLQQLGKDSENDSEFKHGCLSNDGEDRIRVDIGDMNNIMVAETNSRRAEALVEQLLLHMVVEDNLDLPAKNFPVDPVSGSIENTQVWLDSNLDEVGVVSGVSFDPLPTLNAGVVAYPQLSATTLASSTKRSPGKPKQISTTLGNIQPNGPSIIAKAQNTRDVTKLLGFYSNDPCKECESQKRCPM